MTIPFLGRSMKTFSLPLSQQHRTKTSLPHSNTSLAWTFSHPSPKTYAILPRLHFYKKFPFFPKDSKRSIPEPNPKWKDSSYFLNNGFQLPSHHLYKNIKGHKVHRKPTSPSTPRHIFNSSIPLSLQLWHPLLKNSPILLLLRVGNWIQRHWTYLWLSLKPQRNLWWIWIYQFSTL